MRYYETSVGLFESDYVPAGATELTAEQYETRLEEIQAYAAAHPPVVEEVDPSALDIDDAEALTIITGGAT